MRRTEEEITAEIKLLREMKPNVRRTSVFGDNHHDAIDAQVTVLEDELDNDAIYDRFEPGDSEDINFDEGRAENVLNSAIEAMEWRDGDAKETPSEGWKSLLKE